MPSNRMDMNAVVINFEVDPIETEGLQQAQHTLTKEGIDSHYCTRLEENRQDAIAKHERNEGVVAFNAVLDVDSRGELKVLS